MNEHQSLSHLVMNLRQAENCCRQMAAHRRDPRWIMLARRMSDLHELAAKVAQASARQSLVLMPGGRA